MSEKIIGPNTDLPTRLPPGGRGGSLLIEDSVAMDRNRRHKEQKGHRESLGLKVHEREHPEQQDQQNNAPEGGLQNHIKEHPLLATQKNDGVDTSMSGKPDLNTEARLIYDNEIREQNKEKQLKNELQLGNTPKFNPKPYGP